MKLLLTSTYCKVGERLLDLINDQPEKTKVGFIANAADPYEDKWFVKDDRDKLEQLGFVIVDYDLRGKSKEEVEDFLKSIEVVFLAGGAPNYLLSVTRECQLDQVVASYVEQGLVYVGSSSGAIIAGPNTEPFLEYEKEDLVEELKLDDYRGFHLVDFVILPHDNQEEFKKSNDEIIKKYSQIYQFERLKDEEAIVVEDSQIRRIKENLL